MAERIVGRLLGRDGDPRLIAAEARRRALEHALARAFHVGLDEVNAAEPNVGRQFVDRGHRDRFQGFSSLVGLHEAVADRRSGCSRKT
jgi:hypothetical protein